MAAPLATYRVQLHRGFGFDDVAAIAPYLAELGVSHVYCSPYLQAAPGSTHGYDVVDHSRLNEELGGQEGFERMVAALEAVGLRHIVDIVPNHMSVAAGRRNAWWWDVLENGPSSRFASFFDIDWTPPDERLRQRVLLPVLGDHYGRILDSGDLRVAREGGSFVVRYFEHEAPVSPRTVDELLGEAAAACGSDELESVAVAFGRLPPASATDRASVEERHRDKEVLRARLARLLEEQTEVAAAVDAALEAVNADVDRLDGLLQRQNFRLAFWRTAGQELDYRRFFDVPELVALRVEDPAVFEESHALVLGLVADGKVDGLRIDHPDGLRDPAEYLARLPQDVYVVVEKILGADEGLRRSWPVAGTTGYDYLNRVLGLFVDPQGEGQMTELYGRFTGEETDFETVAYEAQQLVMRQALAADLDRLTALATEVCDRHRRYRDYTRRDLRASLRELAACFPVYRSYVVPGRDGPDAEDVALMEAAVAEATERRPDLDPELLAFLRDVLLGRVEGGVEADLALRFQQFSSPVMAKGVEDTAFYRYFRLAALNEVGGEPGRFGRTVEEFHSANAAAAEAWPATMLATSTHDTKRAEDVRARMAVLSEVPGPWALAVRRWAARNAERRHRDWPEANTEYLLYQTLVGAWPIDVERVQAYLSKAVKEAKRQTSWIDPDEEYEAAVAGFAAAVLADEEFVAELENFLRPVVEAGRVNSLAQTLLKLTSPGVPDLYQGTELWDLSLVDPDNRRPVDYDLRRQLLDKVAGMGPGEAMALLQEGAAKLWLITRTLGARRRLPGAFAPGAGYRPLWAEGEKADHVVAYLRGDEAVVVVPRLALGLDGHWGDTTLVLPPGRWADGLAGRAAAPNRWEGEVALTDLLAEFPVALLERA
ncbi:MAG: malto-oligosyltrehalose synthase [Acidimicrobiia bacterium]